MRLGEGSHLAAGFILPESQPEIHGPSSRSAHQAHRHVHLHETRHLHPCMCLQVACTALAGPTACRAPPDAHVPLMSAQGKSQHRHAQQWSDAWVARASWGPHSKSSIRTQLSSLRISPERVNNHRQLSRSCCGTRWWAQHSRLTPSAKPRFTRAYSIHEPKTLGQGVSRRLWGCRLWQPWTHPACPFGGMRHGLRCQA